MYIPRVFTLRAWIRFFSLDCCRYKSAKNGVICPFEIMGNGYHKWRKKDIIEYEEKRNND